MCSRSMNDSSNVQQIARFVDATYERTAFDPVSALRRWQLIPARLLATTDLHAFPHTK